jgi:tetratricopeptide (TPR) repeat protein
MQSALLIALFSLGASPSCAAPLVNAPLAAPAQRSYESLVKIARTYCDAGKADKALKPLKQAIAQSPKRPEAYGVLGYAHAMQRQLTQSAEAYENARQRGSRERRVFMELSSVYDVQKKYSEAIGVYRDFLKHFPKDHEMRHELGLSLILTDQVPEAIAELTTVVTQAPTQAAPRRDLAYAFARAGHHDKAAPHLQKLFPKSMEFGLLLEFVQTYSSPKEALIFFDRYAQKPLDERHQKIRAHLLGLTRP